MSKNFAPHVTMPAEPAMKSTEAADDVTMPAEPAVEPVPEDLILKPFAQEG